MQKKYRLISAITTSVLLIGGGTGAAAYGISNEVSINNKGEITKVRTFDKKVDDILENEGIKISKIEKVTPDVNQEITGNSTIIVEKLATINISTDDDFGDKTIYTDAKTVGDALKEAGYTITNQRTTPSLDTEIKKGGSLAITIETPHDVTFKGQKGEYTVEDTFDKNIGELADRILTDYNPKTDELKPGRDTVIDKDLTIDITRNRTDERTETEKIAYSKKTVESDDMYEGEKKVTTKGKDGEKTKTLKDTKVNGKVIKTEVVKEETTVKPVDEITTVGTKEKPVEKVEEKKETTDNSTDDKDSTSDDSDKASTKSSSSSSKSSNNDSSTTSDEGSTSSRSTKSSRSSERTSTKSSSNSSKSSSSSSNGSGLLKDIPKSKIAQFDKLAQCESSGNWSIDVGLFEGGVQFLNSTWLAYGGGEFAPHANEATREEQIYVANKLQKVTGWKSWPGCSAKYGWN